MQAASSSWEEEYFLPASDADSGATAASSFQSSLANTYLDYVPSENNFFVQITELRPIGDEPAILFGLDRLDYKADMLKALSVMYSEPKSKLELDIHKQLLNDQSDKDLQQAQTSYIQRHLSYYFPSEPIANLARNCIIKDKIEKLKTEIYTNAQILAANPHEAEKIEDSLSSLRSMIIKLDSYLAPNGHYLGNDALAFTQGCSLFFHDLQLTRDLVKKIRYSPTRNRIKDDPLDEQDYEKIMINELKDLASMDDL